MTGDPVDQICLPPDLPQYLRSVRHLKPIMGVPTNEDMIDIHTVIRIAHKFVDVPDMCNPTLLSQLSEHLFNVQMARYRSKHPCSIFPVSTIYTPPTLPAHVPVNLEPVSGLPSNEQVVKVQSAIRLYQRFEDIPAMFDPQLYADLSQHLFDIQMERYIQSRGSAHTRPASRETGVTNATERPGLEDEPSSETNNAGTGASVGLNEPSRVVHDVDTRDAIERSNPIAERANLLIEQSNRIAERSNQLVERPNQTAERSNQDFRRFSNLFERVDQRHQQSAHHAQELTQPLAKIGDVLRNMNKVLVGIRHAIVRNPRGNKLGALDCLVNEKGETPGTSEVTSRTTFGKIFGRGYACPEHQLRVIIGGFEQTGYIADPWLGNLLSFYGIEDGLCENTTSTKVITGRNHLAQERLYDYLSSRLG